MEQETIKVITNTLSNIYDWESDDLRSDFINFLNSEYSINKGKLGYIFDSFDSLSPVIRDSVTFNLNQFVLRQLN
jgi:hypothetical protein